MSTTKPLPVSTAAFSKIIRGHYLYIDKTATIYQLIAPPTGSYFIARPRRFGKTLLISTLEALFLGQRDLFSGLWIAQTDYDWQPHTVLRLDFSQEPCTSAADLQQTITAYLTEIGMQYGVDLPAAPYYRQFRHLIQTLSQDKPLVVLIDEYDKPLIDNLNNPTEVGQIQAILKGFYAVLKAMEAHLRLVLITGISKFSKVSLFSDLNNLNDLTFDTQYATLLGITEVELRYYFADRLPSFATREGITVDDLLARIRAWYDGFRFSQHQTTVYNPFSTMLLFEKFSFRNYWFESGTPTFLIDLIKTRDYDLTRFSGMKIRETAFSTYDVTRLDIVPLLYQTGYLTIKEYIPSKRLYTLAYPNREVEEAFLTWLLGAYSYLERGIGESYLWDLVASLENNNIEQLFDTLVVFFANIPYDLQIKQEKYYQTIFYLIFMMLGFRVEAEVKTQAGRIDAVVETDKHIYLFEFKVNKTATDALQQIKDNSYYQKYQRHKKSITGIEANFNTQTRTIDDWKTSQLS